MKASTAQLYEFGEFRLDPEKGLLSRSDTPVPLTPRVFETLLFMVENHGAVLDKERLMEAVWPDSIVEENNLTQNISTLRRIFGETPGSHRFIVTVPGRGYRFVAEVITCEKDASMDERLAAVTDPKEELADERVAPVQPVAARKRNLRLRSLVLFPLLLWVPSLC